MCESQVSGCRSRLTRTRRVELYFCGNVQSLSCPKDIRCSFVLDVKSQWMSHTYAKSCPGVFVCRCFIDRLVVPLVPHSKDLHLPILPTTVDTCSYVLVVCPCVPLHVSVSLYPPLLSQMFINLADRKSMRHPRSAQNLQTAEPVTSPIANHRLILQSASSARSG